MKKIGYTLQTLIYLMLVASFIPFVIGIKETIITHGNSKEVQILLSVFSKITGISFGVSYLGYSIITVVMVIILFILAAVMCVLVHEIGHATVYKLTGATRVTIGRSRRLKPNGKRVLSWSTYVDNDDYFDNMLKETRPIAYYWLCMSGMYLGTLVNIVIITLMFVFKKNDLDILAGTMWAYSAGVFATYVDNVLFGGEHSDGFKARAVLRKIINSN